MTSPDPAAAPDLRRFVRWARRIRFAGRFLCRTEHRPAAAPDTHGRPVVMVANHRSLADVFVALEALDHFGLRARCLVRAKYFEIPLAGRWLRAIDCIPAGDGKRESVETALRTLASGRPVAVMAEGRITPPDQRARRASASSAAGSWRSPARPVRWSCRSRSPGRTMSGRAAVGCPVCPGGVDRRSGSMCATRSSSTG
ncbi:MAG: lysophospholipid acyltransferase family protein [Acidimicrobiales bacterium]